MTLEVKAISKSEDGDAQSPQLEPQSLHNLSMPAADSSISLGAVLVAEGCAASNASYHLNIRVAGVPESLTVPFTFTNASGWTQERSAAEQRRNEAQRLVNALTAAGCNSRGKIQDARRAVQQVLEAAQGDLGRTINMGNWAQEKQYCQSEWDRLHQHPAPRPVQLARPKLLEWQRAELDRVPGVIGFAYELLYVADDDRARLLSWFAGKKLEDLFVTTAGTKNVVKKLWARWGLMHSQSLDIVYLSNSPRPGPLPHTGDPLLCLPNSYLLSICCLPARYLLVAYLVSTRCSLVIHLLFSCYSLIIHLLPARYTVCHGVWVVKGCLKHSKRQNASLFLYKCW